MEQITWGEIKGATSISEEGVLMILSEEEACDLSRSMDGCGTGLDKVLRIR